MVRCAPERARVSQLQEVPVSTLRRRKIIAQLREEGRAAYHAGRHVQTNPHKYMDALQWHQGYVDAQHEAERFLKAAGVRS